MNDYARKCLTEAARKYIETDKALRGNPINWSACGPDEFTAEGQEYLEQSAEHRAATAELWMVTDCEYNDKDALVAACWEWRYQRVMVRKCCWSQRDGDTSWARETMKKLDAAEQNLMDLLGLSDLYKAPIEYIKERFPKLATLYLTSCNNVL